MKVLGLILYNFMGKIGQKVQNFDSKQVFEVIEFCQIFFYKFIRRFLLCLFCALK